MRYIQKFIGYLFFYSIVNTVFSWVPLIWRFVIDIVIFIAVKVTPHPVSRRNPFAFALRFRSVQKEHQ